MGYLPAPKPESDYRTIIMRETALLLVKANAKNLSYTIRLKNHDNSRQGCPVTYVYRVYTSTYKGPVLIPHMGIHYFENQIRVMSQPVTTTNKYTHEQEWTGVWEHAIDYEYSDPAVVENVIQYVSK